MLINRAMRPILMMPADDDPGGGGGDKTPITREEMQEAISKTVNSALGARLKAFEGKLPTAETITTTVMGALEERLKAFTPPVPDDKDKTKTPPQPDPQVAKLQSQIEELTKRNKEEERLRLENDAKAKRTEERSALEVALRKGGVQDHHLRALVPFLHTEAAKIKRADDGAIVWPVKRDWGNEDVSLDDGVTEWLKTDEGKAFLPPVEAGGAGSRGGRPPSSKGDPNKPMTHAEMGNLVLREFGGGGGGQ